MNTADPTSARRIRLCRRRAAGWGAGRRDCARAEARGAVDRPGRRDGRAGREAAERARDRTSDRMGGVRVGCGTGRTCETMVMVAEPPPVGGDVDSGRAPPALIRTSRAATSPGNSGPPSAANRALSRRCSATSRWQDGQWAR
jgi:hypothetical protein